MFTREDLVKFYELHIHYDIASNNIGVIEKEKFNRLIRMIRKEYKNNTRVKVILNENHNKLTIIENELETTYILIQKPQDLRGKFFRKYI